MLGNSGAPAEKKKKNRKKIEARFTLYTTSQPDMKNMTELIDEWMIEPVWVIPKNRFLACLLSFKTRPGFENNLSHARMVGDITSRYRLKIYSIYNIQFRLHFILNISWYHVTESALPREFFSVSLSLKYLVTFVNFCHLRFIAYCINFFLCFPTVCCE